jgi:hypothetical protein
MTTDWKSLCAELAETLAEEYGVQREFDSGAPLLGSGAIELLSRARTALDQPEPEEPTVMEIIALADEITAEELGLVDLVRRALARWGRPVTTQEAS